MRKNNIRHILGLICLIMSSVASAQDGSSAYNWLNITSSSKIYGLGGVNISLVDDELQCSDQNPGLLGSEMSGQVAVNYMRYLGGTNLAGVRYAHSAGDKGAWAFGIQYFGYGSMKETLADGTIVGSFSPMDASFSVTYSHDINDRLRGGATLKGLYSAYADYTAFAVAADVGINYFDPETDTSLSLVLANMGGQVKRFADAYDRVPFDVRLGLSKVFGEFPVRFSVTAWNLTKWSLPYTDTGDGTANAEIEVKDSFGSNLFRHLVFGADLISSDKFYIGIGYNHKMRTDMSTYTRSFLSGWSLAGGIKGRGFGLGIAYAKPHTGATTFMMNLNLNINDLLR